jgi:hypothetical protein
MQHVKQHRRRQVWSLCNAKNGVKSGVFAMQILRNVFHCSLCNADSSQCISLESLQCRFFAMYSTGVFAMQIFRNVFHILDVRNTKWCVRYQRTREPYKKRQAEPAVTCGLFSSSWSCCNAPYRLSHVPRNKDLGVAANQAIHSPL